MKFKYVILLIGLFFISIISLKAYANATCNQQNTSELILETSLSRQIKGITSCFRIKINDKERILTVKLKVSVGMFNLYLARGANVITFKDTNDQINLFPIASSDGLSTFVTSERFYR